MIQIGLLSDTHSYLDPLIFKYFEPCDEIWHAGDFGSQEVIDKLRAFKPLRGVYGNIDNAAIRRQFPEILHFSAEGVKVVMIHIGGYPGRYQKKARLAIEEFSPDLFISGHSHILKIMRDPRHPLLHINPGACGLVGWHKIKTMVRFKITDARIHQVEVIELGKRGTIKDD